MKIVWTNSAIRDNAKNINFLFEIWDLLVVLAYEKKVIKTEELLLKNPHLGMYDKHLKHYKILVVSQIYMMYEIIDKNIYILKMFNNHQNPLY